MDGESIPLGPVAFVRQQAHGLPGRLGFCPAPGRWRLGPFLEPGRMLDEDLRALRACGTTVLVVLLEEEEMRRIGLAELPDRAAHAGMEVIWFPLPDGTAPTDPIATARLVDRILQHVAGGRTVVVHCHAGIGRSGTITALCLVAAGAEPARALAFVRESRPDAATAPGQEECVFQFAAARAR